MKYNIMFNYGSDGFNFHKEDDGDKPRDFDTIGEAIAFAMELGYPAKFIIVTVVDYKKLILGSEIPSGPINR